MSETKARQPTTVAAGAGEAMGRDDAAYEPPRPTPPAEEPESFGLPRWVFVAGFGLLIAAVVFVFAVRWQRQQGLRVEEPLVIPSAVATTTAGAGTRPATSPALAPTAVAGAPDIAVENVLPPSSPLALEVRAGLTDFWEVYAEAAYTLDDSHLAEVAAGPALEFVTSQIARLKAEGRAIRAGGDHTSTIFNATESKAFVYDRFRQQNTVLDGATKGPISTPAVPTPGPSPAYVYVLELLDGTWKMTQIFAAKAQ